MNTAGAVQRLTNGDEAYQSFHKEHDERMMVLPCPATLPVCADDKVSADGPFCFVYTTFFKKVKLRFPLTRFERELLTELNIAAAQLHPTTGHLFELFK